MKLKKVLLLSLLSFSFLSVQGQVIKPIKKAKKSTQLDKPIMADIAMTKCDRYMKYYKKLLKIFITADPPSFDNPIEIAKDMPRARLFYNYVTNGHIVMDKRSGSVPFPPLNMIISDSGSGIWPVDVSSFTFIDTQDGQSSTISLAWELGSYSDVIEVTDVYKVGNITYLEFKRSNGTLESIRFFPGHHMDGCEIPVR